MATKAEENNMLAFLKRLVPHDLSSIYIDACSLYSHCEKCLKLQETEHSYQSNSGLIKDCLNTHDRFESASIRDGPLGYEKYLENWRKCCNEGTIEGCKKAQNETRKLKNYLSSIYKKFKEEQKKGKKTEPDNSVG